MLGYSFTITPMSLKHKISFKPMINLWRLSLPRESAALPDLCDGGGVNGSKLQLLLLLQRQTQDQRQRLTQQHTTEESGVRQLRTYIVFTDVTDELLGFVHGAGCRSKHGERLLVHLTDRHT